MLPQAGEKLVLAVVGSDPDNAITFVASLSLLEEEVDAISRDRVLSEGEAMSWQRVGEFVDPGALFAHDVSFLRRCSCLPIGRPRRGTS
jgi:hypothetical protein